MFKIHVFHYHAPIKELEGTGLEHKNEIENTDKNCLYNMIDTALENKLTIQVKKTEDGYLLILTTYSNFAQR